MRLPAIILSLLAAGIALGLYSWSRPDISLNDGVSMYKLAKMNKRLIFVCGEDNDGYYHVEVRGTRFLWWLAWHTQAQESYELCFRHEQTPESIKQTLKDFKRAGIRIRKVMVWMQGEREFGVNSDGELVEP